MRSKGFTLIELLTVIVILAIIALIAVPIVLNIINNSKDNSYVRSAEIYAHSIENSVAAYQTLNSTFNPTSCTANNDGTALCDAVTLDVVTKKTSPKSGNIKLVNGQIQEGSTLTFDDVTLTYKNKKWVISEATVMTFEDCFEAAYNDDNKNSVKITGYTCGNTATSYNENDDMYNFNSDGLYTDITLPTELPASVTSKVTFNYDKCLVNMKQMFLDNGSSDDESTNEQVKSICDGYNEVTDKNTEEELIEMASSSSDSELTAMGFEIEKSKTSEKYPVVAIARPFDANPTYKNGITKLTIPDNIIYIGMTAFSRNQIKEIIVSKKLTGINEYAFAYINVDKLTIPGSFSKISSSFSSSKIKELIFTDNTKIVDLSIFNEGISSIEKIVIPCSVEEIKGSLSINTVKEVNIKGKSSLNDLTIETTSSFGWETGKDNSNITWQSTCN